MTTTPAISTISVLADLRPLTGRLQQALSHLTSATAELLHSEVERTGRAVLFRGDPREARRLDRQLRAAALTTTVNRLG